MRRLRSALCPTTALPIAPPSTQSLFARSWRYLDQGDGYRLLRGHYSPVIAPTDSCLDPTCSPLLRPSPVHSRGRLPAFPRQNDFMTDRLFETAAISLCSGPPLCSPPRSSLPLQLSAAGQPRLLRPSGTCFVASACIGYAYHLPRQLVVWGLSPH